MGILMGRAFREGVAEGRRLRAYSRPRKWSPLKRLEGLTKRSRDIGNNMGPLADVPAMVRIEDERWVFERISGEVLHQLSHRLVIHSGEETRTIGATVDLSTAIKVASDMAKNDGRVILIEPI